MFCFDKLLFSKIDFQSFSLIVELKKDYHQMYV